MKRFKLANQIAFILTVLLCLGFSNARALDIQYSNQTSSGCGLPEKAIILSGPIRPGDDAKIAAWLRQNTWYLIESNPAFVLDSNGGSISEAIRIAETFDQVMASVWLPEKCENPPHDAIPKCSGSCFALLVGAVNRLFADNAVGLNHPVFNRSEFANLDLGDAKRQYQKDFEFYINWLKHKQVPVDLIDKISTHSSDDVYWLKNPNSSSVSETSPKFEKIMTSNCDYRNDLLTQWADAYAEGKFKEAKRLREKWDKQSKCMEGVRMDAREKWALQ